MADEPRVATMPTPGLWAWTFVGLAAALTIVAVVVAALNEILLPLTFAAVLAVVFKPVATTLTRWRLRPSVSAGVVVLGLLALAITVVVATAKGVVDQLDEIGSSVDAAAAEAQAALGVDQATIDAIQASATSMAPALGGGFLTTLVSGIGTLVGIASGVILGALIMYYMVKDGTTMRRTLVAGIRPAACADVDEFIGDACRILRDYGKGRTVMSAIVALVIGITSLLMGLPLVLTIMLVYFVGGIYIGAFLGGGLAVVIALGDGGIPESSHHARRRARGKPVAGELRRAQGHGFNAPHPPRRRAGHARGGLVGGIVGLILAVPFTVILAHGVGRLRARGVIAEVAERAEPVVRRALH